MAQDSLQERNEEATQHRRDKARREGQVAVSTDLTNSIVLLVGLAMLRRGAGGLGEKLMQLFRSQVAAMDRGELTAGEIPAVMQSFLQSWLSLCLPIAVAVAAFGVGVSALQAGILVSTEPLALKWSKLSPVSGLKRLFSVRSVVRTAMMLLRIATSVGVVVWMLRSRGELFAQMGQGTIHETVLSVWDLSFTVAIGLASAYFAISIADYAYQRFQHDRDLRMSKQDVKDEQNEHDGNAQTKARVRKLQKESVKQRMLLNVPAATVVITNPTHYAVALKYERNTKQAPMVVAKGKDALALRIIRIARENGVSVIERKPLARALFAMVEVNQEIPPELYKAIAKILAYVYGIRRRRSA